MNKIEINSTAVLGVGNILECDDGFAIYATKYLEKNYKFTPNIDIINGGVEGINLLNLFMQYKRIIILDTINIEDEIGSIYHIPSSELAGLGINSAGAHEMGVIQCIDMLELMGKELPNSSILGIIPEEIFVKIGLSRTLHAKFESYIKTVLDILQKEGVQIKEKEQKISLDEIIINFQEARI